MIELLGFELDPTLFAMLIAAVGLAGLILVWGIVAIARRATPESGQRDERDTRGHARHRSAVADEDPILAAMGLEPGPRDPGAPAPGDRTRGTRA